MDGLQGHLDTVLNRKISCAYRESNPGYPVVKPTVPSLYLLKTGKNELNTESRLLIATFSYNKNFEIFHFEVAMSDEYRILWLHEIWTANDGINGFTG
jgi:hypothetical protein